MLLSGVKMTSETEANSVWKLTILRNGEQGNPDSLEDAEFRFGRYKDEVYRSPCAGPHPGDSGNRGRRASKNRHSSLVWSWR